MADDPVRTATDDPTAASAPTPPREAQSTGRAYPFERALIERRLRAIGSPPIRVVLWDEQTIEPASDPLVTLHFRTRQALIKSAINPERYFGDGYADGSIGIEGDLRQFLRLVYRCSDGRPSVWHQLKTRLLPGRNTLAGSQKNIHHHYNIGNDFYKLWLDADLVYTCAYYPTADTTLAEAQRAKLDHVCRKLELEPGQHVVEAGCGWGALAMHMAEHYGVHVRAFNISTAQISYARQEAQRRGISDRVEFVQDDYRNIQGEYDAFASVGMLEHVGYDNYRTLGSVINRTLKRGGRGLIHSIGRHRPLKLNAWIEANIFPGAYPPTLREMMDILEPNNLAVLDVENLRLHYERTCSHWLDRFEQNVEAVRQMFDDRFVRMWRLYLTGSAEAFESGTMQLFQVVFARNNDNGVPRTREHMYPQTQPQSQERAGAAV